MDLYSKIQEATNAVKNHFPNLVPNTAIILGTGLGGLVQHLENAKSLHYSEIPHMSLPTVLSHEGILWVGELSGQSVIVFQGRFHVYEGYSLEEVTFPVRLAQALGCKNLFVSNVAGAINPLFKAGEIVAISDHINLLGTSPLVGANDNRLGPRFPDMIEPYSLELLDETRKVALSEGILLHRGVYACMSGPQLETRAEYRMLKVLGADMIGMSTVPEVIVAVHAGLKVLGLTVLTDECFPDALQPVSIPKIMAYASAAEPNLIKLIEGVLLTFLRTKQDE
jgi:purine-nucleoside phosphorylase